MGLAYIDTKVPCTKRLTTANGLISDHGNSIVMDHNDISGLANGNGVQLIDPENHKLTAFTRSEGLAANDVYDLIGHKNKIFLGTSNGLSILESLYVPNDNKVHWKVKTIGNRSRLGLC